MIDQVPLDKIRPNPYQPESRVNIPDEIAEKFGKSILEYGLLQTPVARLILGDGATSQDQVVNGHYEMADGWLRLSGFRWLFKQGRKEYTWIPLDIRDLNDQQMADMVLEANTIRKDMTPIDEAKFFKRYLEDFKVTEAQLAKSHNITQGALANKIRLLELPAEIQEKVISQEITETHARQFLRLNYNPELQTKILDESVKQGYSVSQLGNQISQNIYYNSANMGTEYNNGDPPIFDTSHYEGCQHKQKIGAPYQNNQKSWRCLDKKCWQQKQDQAEKEKADKLAAEIAAAKKNDNPDGIIQVDNLSWRDYQDLDSRAHPIDNQEECKTCQYRGQGKAKYRSGTFLICTNVKCFKKKEKALEDRQAELAREEERKMTDRLKAVCDQLELIPSLKIILNFMVKDCRVDTRQKFASMYGIKLPGKAAEDIAALKLSLDMHSSFEELMQMAAALVLDKIRYETEPEKFDYILATLEGNPDKFLEKIKAYQSRNCQGCIHEDDGLECSSLWRNYKNSSKCWSYFKSKDEETDDEEESEEEISDREPILPQL